MHKYLLLPLSALLCTAEQPVKFSPQTKLDARQYICYRTDSPIKIDGKLDEEAWQKAPWTEEFGDILGEKHPVKPRHRTRAKMLWDDNYLYIAAYLEEPHVWGTLTERESVIFYDNDFEVFIDPDGDTHNYMELEINALGTEWDLMLTKPYRDWGGLVLDTWNINGMKSAIHVDGSINNGDDIDKGWYVELALPLDSLCEAAPEKPKQGTQWRINFSRVQWTTRWDAESKKYVKIPHALTGKEGSGSEDNWVWSPQEKVNMHDPETWGFMQFSEKTVGSGKDSFVWNRNEEVKWALRQFYMRMREYQEQQKKRPTSLEDIKASEIKVEGLELSPSIIFTEQDWEIAVDGFDGKRLYITSDGKVSYKK